MSRENIWLVELNAARNLARANRLPDLVASFPIGARLLPSNTVMLPGSLPPRGINSLLSEILSQNNVEAPDQAQGHEARRPLPAFAESGLRIKEVRTRVQELNTSRSDRDEWRETLFLLFEEQFAENRRRCRVYQYAVDGFLAERFEGDSAAYPEIEFFNRLMNYEQLETHDNSWVECGRALDELVNPQQVAHLDWQRDIDGLLDRWSRNDPVLRTAYRYAVDEYLINKYSHISEQALQAIRALAREAEVGAAVLASHRSDGGLDGNVDAQHSRNSAQLDLSIRSTSSTTESQQANASQQPRNEDPMRRRQTASASRTPPRLDRQNAGVESLFREVIGEGTEALPFRLSPTPLQPFTAPSDTIAASGSHHAAQGGPGAYARSEADRAASELSTTIDSEREPDHTDDEEDSEEEAIGAGDLPNLTRLREAIDNLPVHTVSATKKRTHIFPSRAILSHVGKCTICQFEYKLADELKELKCGHTFHKGCIIPWLPVNMTCPLCRELAFDVGTEMRLRYERAWYIEHLSELREMQVEMQDLYEDEVRARAGREAIEQRIRDMRNEIYE
ncbi:hypothetical protein NA57DRAFT_56906 [Rhizodiscina lignyota]|uniref:RING-type domain-containing protein n=1 Tax=Rhizodiscina lignyota TaxID=1504668 RepID=A0A9P4IE94_9PEZI|nr:hypothetical protein NA57DRAFT_56906 [Rhizodiscina lignyota]